MNSRLRKQREALEELLNVPHDEIQKIPAMLERGEYPPYFEGLTDDEIVEVFEWWADMGDPEHGA